MVIYKLPKRLFLTDNTRRQNDCRSFAEVLVDMGQTAENIDIIAVLRNPFEVIKIWELKQRLILPSQNTKKGNGMPVLSVMLIWSQQSNIEKMAFCLYGMSAQKIVAMDSGWKKKS